MQAGITFGSRPPVRPSARPPVRPSACLKPAEHLLRTSKILIPVFL